jgi:hypothetical protein
MMILLPIITLIPTPPITFIVIIIIVDRSRVDYSPWELSGFQATELP